MLEPTCAVTVSVFNREHMVFALNLSAYLMDERADLANAFRSVSIDEKRVVRITFIPVLTKKDFAYVEKKFAFVCQVENMVGFTLQLT
jgi:hypothetical protein